MAMLLNLRRMCSWVLRWSHLPHYILIILVLTPVSGKGQPNSPPFFTNCPEPISSGYCDPVVYDFEAIDGDGDPMNFELVAVFGGGDAQLDPQTGVLIYSPVIDDVNTTVSVVARVCDINLGCDTCEVSIMIFNSAPVIDCGQDIMAQAGNAIIKEDIFGTDPDVCTPLSFTVIDGPGMVNPATGSYFWQTAPEDIGQYEVTIELSDGFDFTVCVFEINVQSTLYYMCGDANGDEFVNVGDAVYLINYVFKNGPPPDPLEAGDVNNDYLVNVGDAVYLINFIFKGGPPPGCEPQGTLWIAENPPPKLSVNPDGRDARNFLVWHEWDYEGGIILVGLAKVDRITGNEVYVVLDQFDCTTHYGALWEGPLTETEYLKSVMYGCDERRDSVIAEPILDVGGNWVEYLPLGAPTTLICERPNTTGTWEVSDGTSKVNPIQGSGPAFSTTAIEVSDEKNDVEIEYTAVDEDGDNALSAMRLTVFQLETTNIKFNHTGAYNGTTDALNLRENFTTALKHKDTTEAGEYIKNIRHEPALYVADKTVTCKARFTIKPAGIASATINASALGTLFANIVDKTVNFNTTTGISTDGLSPPSEFVEMSFEENTYSFISKDAGGFDWNVIEVEDNSLFDAHVFDQSSPHLFYTVLDVPKDPWYKGNGKKPQFFPWVDALDFTIITADTEIESDLPSASETITTFVHGGHGLKYNTINGGAIFFNDPVFDMTGFMTGKPNIINCYDCAGAVKTMISLLGGSSNWLFMDPFGYILKTDLIGIGNCNNPFFSSAGIGLVKAACVVGTPPPVTNCISGATCISDCVSPERTGFWNHAFVEFASKIYDACAGPHIGTETRAQYITAAIDTSTVPEQSISGSTTDISIISITLK